MPRDINIVREEGKVLEALPGLLFKVQMNPDEREVLAHLGGKLKLHHIRVIPGDTVVVEFTPYDNSRGRIVRRL